MKSDGLTRRQVLLAGGSTALSAMLISAPARAAVVKLPAYRRSSYTALTDLGFEVRAPGAVAWQRIELVRVADSPRAATLAKYRGAEHAFALTFAGPEGLAQNTYRFRGPYTRTVDLFLTPVDRAADGTQHYEAVIDRLYAPTRRHPAPRPATAAQ